MQQPTGDVVRVPHQSMQSFLITISRALGIKPDDAQLLARFLVDNDLRGVLSHGSRLIHRYVREITSGAVNPDPHITIVRETDNSLLVDGDGGLGYFPATLATQKAIQKAKKTGMATYVTRNHAHIGAAGNYTRMTLDHDLLCFVTSGVRLMLNPADSVILGAGASPMSFSAPGCHEPAILLDVGVTHDVQANPPHLDQVIKLAPGLVLRALGYGAICQTWGGLLTGLSVNHPPMPDPYPKAHQGAMGLMFRIDLFADPDDFKQEVDAYVKAVRQLTPIPGTQAYLPGGIEAAHEAEYRRDGIPLGPAHRRDLEAAAQQLNLATPW